MRRRPKPERVAGGAAGVGMIAVQASVAHNDVTGANDAAHEQEPRSRVPRRGLSASAIRCSKRLRELRGSSAWSSTSQHVAAGAHKL